MIFYVKCLVASALAATVVNGHGYMTKPEATFQAEAGDKTQFIATIESSTSGFKGTFNTAPADNVAAFTKALASSKYKSLKELINDKAKVTVTGATLACGNAEPDATAQPLPTTVEWSHSDSEGFTASHEGPCEVWCDDVRAFQDDNCAAHFTSAPAELPYESSKCSGASVLTFYWMAMHGPTWQVYVNCAPLSSGGAAPKSSSTSTTTANSSLAGAPTTESSSVGTPTVTSAAKTPTSGGSPSATTAPSTTATDSISADTPTVTSAPSTASTPLASTSPSTSMTSAPSTSTTEESDCGSYDVAGSDAQNTGMANNGYNGYNTFQQGSANTDMASQANNGYSMHQQGSINTDNMNQWPTNIGTEPQANTGNTMYQGTGSQANFNFNMFQGTTNAGTVSPQNM